MFFIDEDMSSLFSLIQPLVGGRQLLINRGMIPKMSDGIRREENELFRKINKCNSCIMFT